MNRPQAQLKIRISQGKTVAMGPGKADLLEAIVSCGSISSAAKQMKMSYKRAWDLIDELNKSFNQPLVMTSPGGKHGGGAKITEFGQYILDNYRRLIAKTYHLAEAELNNITSELRTTDIKTD